MTQEEIIFAVDSMLDYLQFGGDIEHAVKLYQDFGQDDGLKFRLGKMPRDGRLERLLTEKLKETLLKRPYWRIAIKRKELKRKRIKQPEPVVQVVESQPIIIAQDRTEALDEITMRIRQLATKRAKLSNQLQEGDTEDIITHNCNVLDQMQPIESELKTLEVNRARLKTGDTVEENQGLDRVVIVLRNESYTLRELEAMTLAEVKTLKRRLNDMRLKASKKSKDMQIKEKTRKNNQERLVKVNRYLTLVGKIILQKQHA